MRTTVIAVAVGVALAALIASWPAHAQSAGIPTIVGVPWGPANPLARNMPTIIGAPGGTLTPRFGSYGPAEITPMEVPELVPELVPTDPLVRQIQVGPTPVGVLSGVDLSRGVGIANVPGAGARPVRTVGQPVQTPGGPAVLAVDAATGVQFLALLPPPRRTGSAAISGPLAPATVKRVTTGGVIVERGADGATVTEIRPARTIFAATGSGFVLASSVRRLRAGARVYVPMNTAPLGTIVATPRTFGSRASSARGTVSGPSPR